MCHPGQSGHLPCTVNEKHGNVDRDEHLVFVAARILLLFSEDL